MRGLDSSTSAGAFTNAPSRALNLAAGGTAPPERLASSLHAPGLEGQAPGGSRAPESRDQLRTAEGDREGARPRGSTGELGIQGGARAPTICSGASASAAPAVGQAIRRFGEGYPE